MELTGRDSERSVLDRLLDAGRRGCGGSLVVLGEPGIGKSTLLGDVAARAHDFQVLRAVGREAERTLSFAGLSELLRPVLGLLNGLPSPQTAALSGALAIASPIAGDRFTVAAATLSLLAAAAEDRPVLAVVDDAHWLDAASQEALIFACRRVADDRLVMLFAVREDAGDGPEWAGLDHVRLDGIARRAARGLLAEATGRPVAQSVADRLCETTRGNPLAKLEIYGQQQLRSDAVMCRLERAGPRRRPMLAGTHPA